ncbi:MAG: hypothetical protein WD004_07650 [Actinomycetota bacterium]
MTAVDTTESPPELAPSPSRDAVRRLLVALAGPALIVVAVLVAMRGFVIEPLLTNQHADILGFVMPRLCFLGDSLAAGHVPLWNPFLQTGTPYAADPQSGWMYLPPMALFTALPCTVAMRAFIVMQPLLAGIGLFWFLRKEGLARTAATVGGLSISLAMAGSAVGIAMPFSGAIAWTTIVLVGASGYVQVTRWSRRLLWLALAAVAWGQVAGAHMSHGLFMCTLLVTVYLIAKNWHSVRWRERSLGQGAGLIALFLGFVVLANLAFLLPRLGLIPRSALAQGYAALGPTGSATLGVGTEPLADGGIWAAWPFALGSTPGAYLGAAVLLCVPAALRSTKRALLATLGVTAAITYAMTLDLFVGAEWFRNLVLRIPFGDIYIHNPSRLRHLLLIVIPALGALGVQGLMEDPPPRKTTIRWLAAGAVLFLGLPLLLGAYPKRLAILAAGALLIAWPLVALARGKTWARIAVPVVLCVELLSAVAYANAYTGGSVELGLEQRGPWLEAELTLPPGPLQYPDVDTDAYLARGRFPDVIDASGDRYITWAPPAAFFIKGYLFRQEPADWPALFNGRGMLLGVEDAMGYNPFQLTRYWRFVRATNRLPIFYNAALIQEPSVEDARLLGVRFLVAPSGVRPPLSAIPVGTDGGYTLWEIQGAESRVSVVPSWTVEATTDEALAAVLEPGFDPGRTAVLETDPGIRRVDGAHPGTATYSAPTPEDVRVSVTADAPSMVVIRNAWDQNWEATVDGKPSQVLPTDAFLQGVPVPAGEHEIRLVYREPWIWRGLAASGLVWAAWLVAVLAASVLDRRRRAASAAER